MNLFRSASFLEYKFFQVELSERCFTPEPEGRTHQ